MPVQQASLAGEALLSSSADAACECGSGLSTTICCKLDLRRPDLTKSELWHSDALALVARHMRECDRASARDKLVQILERSPGQPAALGAFFNLLRENGQVAAATAVIQRLTMLHPNDVAASIAATQFFVESGEMARAHRHARMLVRLGPEASIAHYLMGRVFLAQSNNPAAEHHLRRSVALASNVGAGSLEASHDAEALLALCLRKMGRFEEARAIFRRLEASSDMGAEVLLAWASLEESDRHFDQAESLLVRAESCAPGDPRIIAMRAVLLRRQKRHEEVLTEVDRLTANSDSGHGALLERAQTLDALGRYDEAFEAWDSFKRQLRERTGISYRKDAAHGLVGSLRAFFSPGRSQLLPRATVRGDHPQPIFIVGFPRSGTTLVEQSLTAHPNISAGDELPIIDGLAERSRELLHSPLPYPRSLSELWLGDRTQLVNTMRDLYLNEAASHGAVQPGKSWFTDKMPLNETHLGLIHLLFPRSPIIHVVRHPLDVVVSVFSNWLTHGFHCANALETAAEHYALTAELIDDYRAALPLNYCAVRYEDMVQNQEKEVRRLFDFIGEPYDPATLAFHENARPARTASYAQVTEKLYDRSVYRHRNYLRHLESIVPVLLPVIERLGYRVDR